MASTPVVVSSPQLIHGREMNRHRRFVSSNRPGERVTGSAGLSPRSRLEQEREPAAGPGLHADIGPHPCTDRWTGKYGGVDERLVLEEVQVSPHALLVS